MDVAIYALGLMVVFLFKHLWVDFYLQPMEEVESKAHYGEWLGIRHSLKHGLFTFAMLVLPIGIINALFLGLLDFIVHYHIDWLKMQGERDVNKPQFWYNLGLDQFAHNATYIVFILVILCI